MKLVGYARVTVGQQASDRQEQDLLAVGVRPDDLYIDHGASGVCASCPAFDRALDALHGGDTLVVTTLDRLGRFTIDMPGFAAQLRSRNAGLRVLNLGGGDVDTATPMGSMVFSVMMALAQMEIEIERERARNSVTKRRTAGEDLGGHRAVLTDSQVREAIRLLNAGEPAARVARDLGMSRAILYHRIRVLQESDTKRS